MEAENPHPECERVVSRNMHTAWNEGRKVGRKEGREKTINDVIALIIKSEFEPLNRKMVEALKHSRDESVTTRTVHDMNAIAKESP